MPAEATARDLGFREKSSLSKNKELIVGKKPIYSLLAKTSFQHLQ